MTSLAAQVQIKNQHRRATAAFRHEQLGPWPRTCGNANPWTWSAAPAKCTAHPSPWIC